MNPYLLTLWGILIPFLGTSLGSATVFAIKKNFKTSSRQIFFGFAAGVMLAASVWSLLIPAMEMASSPLPAVAGLMGGAVLFILGDRLLSRFHKNGSSANDQSRILAFAVTLHNLPEGMAVGVIFAGALKDPQVTSITEALILSLGIALQNFPEGAIISTPMASLGVNKKKAFLWGALSGAVEPIGAVLSLWITSFISPILPLILSFAAGAMIWVVVQELIPDISRMEGSRMGCVSLCAGFSLMMFLDVVLG